MGCKGAVVTLRCGSAIYCREFRTGDVKVLGIPHIDVSGEREPAVEEVEVKTDVPSIDFFPGQEIRDIGRKAGNWNFSSVEQQA